MGLFNAMADHESTRRHSPYLTEAPFVHFTKSFETDKFSEKQAKVNSDLHPGARLVPLLE